MPKRNPPPAPDCGLGLVSYRILGILCGTIEPQQDVAGFDGYLRLQPRNLGLAVGRAGIAIECRGLEQTDRQLCVSAGRRRVGHLSHEIRIDVPEADAAERGAATIDAAGGSDAEQGLVGQDVLPVEETDFTAGQDLAPGSTDSQVHLTHIDLGTEAVVGLATALNLRGKPEVHA